MKIVLLENIDGVGKKYDIKNVNDGYARNFLIPKELAKLATEETIAWANDIRALESEKATQELEQVGGIVSNIDGLEVEIFVKVGDKGQLFEKIDSQDVAEKLKQLGYSVTKKQIEMKPIEDLGEFEAKVKFGHSLEAQIKVIVSQKNSDKQDEDN